MSAGTVRVPLRPGSDGDPTHRPRGSDQMHVDPPVIYLEKLASQWMRSRNQAIPGVKYVLERLPAGYALYEKTRLAGPAHVDKRLYGHPSHKFFDSPNRFFPHFKHLMDHGGNSIGCPCTVCNAQGSSILPMGANLRAEDRGRSGGSVISASKGSIHSQAKGRPKTVLPGTDTRRTDEEGNPDVYRNLIDKLKSNGSLDETITEPMSMDWRAEQEILPKLRKALQDEPQWHPRIGDIVLFVRELPKGTEIVHDPKSRKFRLYQEETKTFVGYPAWEAGFVGQTPVEAADIDDLIQEQQKEMNVSYSGIRVEPLPDPNAANKSLSKRYVYVPLHHTRPFVFWSYLVGSIPQEKWDSTVMNALRLMSTFSLVNKHRFRGTWPVAWIYCSAIYVGSELLAVGDTIRLLPKAGHTECTDVLVIKTIRVKLSNLDLASDNDWDEGRPYNSMVHIFGRGYTMDQTRSSKEWLSMDDATPPVMDKYDTWHPLHPPTKEMQVPFFRVIGRLYEAEAMTLWFPNLSDDEIVCPELDLGREGLLEARGYAKANDQRILNSLGANWYWGDSRADALDLETVNGLEVGKFNTDRDPKDWRHMIKIMEAADNEQDIDDKVGTGAHRSLRGFMAPQHELPVRSGDRRFSDERRGSRTTSTDDASSSAESATDGKKRTQVINVSGDEDEDGDGEEEFRQHTRFIEVEPQNRKKARVMVVID